ncbi:transglycosylase SLT domain-containing protein [Dokdonella sp.]|uniref:transglycosylase SLT domain-containing protein n=1 Tax=Dokdonella sp. TaxID=2291710 RepID=UPI002F403D66
MTRRQVRSVLLGGGILLLGACATPPTRTPQPSAPSPVAPVVVAPPTPPAPPPAPVAEQRSTWGRLRSLFAMQGCDYAPGVQRWARAYTRSPRAFVASWKDALPFLDLVVDEIEQRGLPGEFAMLPYVESTYRPLASRGDTPAGMWQLMPATARGAGLVVRKDYDGRLDALASTQAALDLIADYYREFADWRLADMAFNSGEFRVKKLLGGRDARDLEAADLAKFTFNRITHEHLDRLLALACIVEDPARFNVSLPEPGPDARLRTTELPAGMDLRLAARLAGVPLDDLKRWNAAYRRNRMPDDAPHRLLLPETRVERFLVASQAMPQPLWNDWREERAARTSGIGSWASQLGVPVAALAAANAVAEDATVLPSTRLLLPGREAEPVDASGSATPDARVHVIAAGDTLSGVAQRYGIPLRRLQQLNPRAGRMLRLGDKLRLDAS